MLSPVYSPIPLTVLRANGISIETDQGTFLDTYSGIGVMAFGHSYPPTVEAVVSKIRRYSHISNYLLDEDALPVARRLLKMTGRKGEVFFANSGTEATEAAIKAIKKMRGGKLVSFNGNFHGRTTGALALTYSPKIRLPFRDLLPDTVFLPLERDAFLSFASENSIAGVFLECIQGNSGVLPIPKEIAETVMEFREKNGYLVVADEIQAGLGRTGRYYSYQHYDGLEPDIITTGKATGGGLPLGAAIFLGISPFNCGDHGSTFAPSPVSLAAGRSVLERLTPDLLEDIREKGEYFVRELSKLSWAREIRGRGLMIGISADHPNQIKERAFERRVLLNVTSGGIRLLPALNITSEEIDEIISRLKF